MEQLCINFCNEKLQQLFNYTVFKLEEKVYKSENIGVDHVQFIDNQPILDLIEKKPKAILPMLDEEKALIASRFLSAPSPNMTSFNLPSS